MAVIVPMSGTNEPLATDFVHSGATDRALSFHSRFAIFHRHSDGFWIITLRSAFYTIHLRHFFIHLPSTKDILLLRQCHREQEFTDQDNSRKYNGFDQIFFHVFTLSWANILLRYIRWGRKSYRGKGMRARL